MREQYSEAWRDYFVKSGYKALIQSDTDGIRKLNIDEFCNENGTVPEELSEIYLLCSESGIPCELLLVIDIRRAQIKENKIKNLCSKWDERILSFINFDALPNLEKQSLYLLKYNVLQILLCDELTTSSPAAISMEKSTEISRKLFISTKNGDVTEMEQSMLPFCFDQLIVKSIAPESESELRKKLPQRDELKFLFKANSIEKEFSEEELTFVKEWLNNDKD